MIVDAAEQDSAHRIRAVRVLADLEISVAVLIRLRTAYSRSPFSLRTDIFEDNATPVNRFVRLGRSVFLGINNETSFNP